MRNDNVEKFIELYNTFDDLLREKFKEFSRSFSMIQRYIDQLENSPSDIYRKKARKIDMIRILRNNLIHEFDLNNENLIAISDDTISFLEREIEYLKNPITAYDICTRSDELYCVYADDDVDDVLANMALKGFTQVPVLDVNKKLIGVFSPNVIFGFLASKNNNLSNDLKIRDFFSFTPMEKHISEKYAFIERNATLDEVMELFEKSHRLNKKLVAIFVSENGRLDQKLLGMIVPYDLLKINK